MRAVEHAQLRGLIGRDVGHQFGASSFPARARAGEIILDHPLAESFGDHRALVACAERGFDRGAVGVGRGGDDAVDHRRGTGAFAIEPRRQVGVIGGEIFAHQTAQHRAIAREIVAAEQGEPAEPRRLARREPGGEEAIETWVPDRCGEVERAVGAAQIAFLGDGEADDMRAWRRDRIDHRLAVAGRDEHFLHRADQAEPRARGAARADGIEPVLRTQLRRDVARAQRHADDAPVAIARVHRIVGIDRLMRAVEGADADMDDARRLRAAVVAWRLHRRREWRLRRQPHSLYAALARL